MGLYLASFEFEGTPPTKAEFVARYSEMYTPRVLDLYEVAGSRVEVGCLLDPCGIDYVQAVMRGLGGRGVRRNGEPFAYELPEFTSTPWRRLSWLARLRARYGACSRPR